MTVKFRRYGNRPVDIANYVKDKQCNCRGPFHHCRNTDLLHVLKGCKCDHGRMTQLSNPCPCEEPVVYGTNILADPSFENHLAETGGGPLANEIPGVYICSGGSGAEVLVPAWTDATPYSGSKWVGERNIPSGSCQGLNAAKWFISTASPRTGTYHARFTKTTNSSLQEPGWLIPTFGATCETTIQLPENTRNFKTASAVLNPGDFIRFKYYGKVSVAAINGWPQATATISFFNASGVHLQQIGVASTTVGTSYESREISGIAPASTRYAVTRVDIFDLNTHASGYTADVDDCELELA